MIYIYIFLLTLFFVSPLTNANTSDKIISRQPFTANINVNTGVPSTDNTLSFVTNNTEAMNIDGSGNVIIVGLANQGVVHTDAYGMLSTSSVVNSDIDDGTIANAKLATIDSANTSGAIVVRDNSGDFSAGTITADLIGDVTGSASLNVLKTGDSMSGGLNMLNQQPVIFQDSNVGNYVGINAPIDVIASYTLSLPDTVPTISQSLRAGSLTPTQLEWISAGGSVPPATSHLIYVTKYGNDTTGNGSFDLPYASLAKAIDVANVIASASTPATIVISPGVYTEDNSTAPLSIDVAGVSIIGESPNAVILMPNTPANGLLTANETVYVGNVSFVSSSPMATGISLSGGTLSTFNNVQITNFATGIACAGSSNSYLCELCTFVNNGIGLLINNTVAEVNSCTFVGGSSLYGPPANTGISIAGSVSVCSMSGGSVVSCSTGLEIGSNSLLTASAITFKLNGADVIQTDASHMTLSACTFAITTTTTDIDIQISGAGTYAEIVGCQFNGLSIDSIPQATALYLSDGATLALNGGGMKYYTTAIQLGAPSDTSTTQLTVSGFDIESCTNYIVQQGSTYLNFNGSTASSSGISINDPTYVTLAYFDLDNNNALTVGTTADTNLDLLQAAISNNPTDNPGLNYQSSLYSTQAIGITNPTSNPSTSFIIANADANFTAVTTDRTQAASINLFSDEGSTVGGTSALRGWELQKTYTTASLAFNYQNSDTIGQGAVSEYTVMQLDGVNNQLQLPAAGTQIVFDGDTNLYRSAANVLKTDDNFIVGTLTPNRAVITNASNELASSITTDTELSYLSGTTSSVQTQLNGKVAKAGDTMTGTLQLPAGATTAPSLTFTGSTTTGLSASGGSLSLSANGAERMKIASDGVVSIDGFTIAGVVHNDAFGNLSSSLIVDADVSPTANIADSKLATITTAGKVANSATTAVSTNTPSTIVLRDSSGNFSAGTVTANLTGNVTGSASNNVLKAGDTMTGSLTMPAGTAASPSIKFTGSTNTGISAATMNTLSFDTNGVEAMNIDGSGNVTIDGLDMPGVVHTNAFGMLSTSSVVGSDIADGTIENSSLADISSSNIPGDIVVRDGSGNFSTNQVTILGSVTNPTDTATKAYVDSAISTGIVAKTPALVVSTTDVPISGLQTIDGVMLADNDRVLLVGQTDEVDNGLWLAQTGSWTRPSDFANGSTAAEAYVLILSGDTDAGSSWLCNTPTAVIGTDDITFAEFSLPNQVTGANVGSGTGQVYQSKSGLTLNFRTLLDGEYTVITTNADDITIDTDATSSNIPSTSVARDASGNFSAGTITAALIGSASLNVLKAGDSMSGGLNMLNQQPVVFQDSTEGNYVGINVPTEVIASYTLSLPDTAPTISQSLRAGSSTPTQLEWVSAGGSEIPADSYVIYVTKYGNDVTGNGSFDLPYASLAKAIDVANGIASAFTPVTILISAGAYTEDNSAAPLSINVAGVSIVGDSPSSVIFIPSTPANDFLTVNDTTYIDSATFMSLTPTATGIGISLTNGEFSILNNLQIISFGTGIECAGITSSYLCELCTFVNNGTGLVINNTIAEVNACTITGGDSLYGTPANTGISITGSVSVCAMSGGAVASCATGLEVGSNSLLTASAVTFKLNGADVIQTDASHMTLSACTFAITTTTTDIDIQISGPGTYAEIVGCQFNGLSIDSIPQATALYLSDGATLALNGGGMKYYTTAIQLGAPGDTSTTQLTVSGFDIENCTNDIIQQGSTYLNFNASTASSSGISINDPTYVTLAYFDLDNNNALTVGTTADTNLDLLQVAISNNPTDNLGLNYQSSLYSTQAIGITNPTSNPSTSFIIANADANFTAVTTDRTQAASINLFSDEGSTVGGTSALRGWELQKTYTTASLAFNYQNSDTIGQGAVSEYTVMQLDGVNNQLQLPAAGTQIVFDGDTNLYRSAANVLKTDDNFIVGTLTPNRAVITNASNELASSITTDTELSYLSGTTSSVQTQLNGKVAKAGDTMTGTLQLPAGITTAPSLTFTGSTTTGLSASSGNLSLSANGLERMKISSSGVVSIDGFTVAGVVHNDSSGNLTTSLIVDSDVSATANIADTKLATITTAGKVANSATTATSADTPSAIVARDSSGDFSAGTITADLDGNATTATTAINFSGSLSGDVTGTQSATVVSFVGGQTAANVAIATELVITATWADVPNTLVLRDASGNFSTNTISLDGNLILDESTSSNIGNIIKGANSFIHNFGTNNTFVGENSGNFVMTGTSNSVFGVGALQVNTAGTGNIAVGYQSLHANTTGSGNTASGFKALSLVTTGTNNIAFGSLAGASLTVANSSNIDIGNTGTAGDNGVIRIGTAGIQIKNFQAGIVGVAPDAANGVPVFISSTGQLGTAGSGANYSAIAPTAATDNNGIIINNPTSQINLEFADATHNGIVSTIAQTFTGTKTFATAVNTPIITSVSGGVITIASGASQYPIGTGALVSVTSGTDLIALGTNALAADTSGSRNIGVGSNALSSITTNNDSTAIGYNALKFNTAFGITAVGSGALTANTTGAQNVAVGYNAQQNNTTGSSNIAIGFNAAVANVTGSGNVAIGLGALQSDVSGGGSLAIGFGALNGNTTGTGNAALGYQALYTNVTGINNTAVGYQSLFNNTMGNDNIAIGTTTLSNNTTGALNTAVGVGALNSNTIGANNTALGFDALSTCTSVSGLTAVGSGALTANTTGIQNTAVGYQALKANTTGTSNTAHGYQALASNTTGVNNTATGVAALVANTTGGANTAVGLQALATNTAGGNNIAIGFQASYSSTTGTDNVAVGTNALYANTVSQLIAVGSGALQANTSGIQNVAVGYQALTANTTGANNTANGYQALANNTTGTSNTAHGYQALANNTIGINNTATGAAALVANTTGSSNTALGFQASYTNTTGDNNVAVGNNALYANTASQLTAVGVGALTANTTGIQNVAVGFLALTANTTGGNNTAHGYQALAHNTTGGANTAVGLLTLATNTTGNNNTSIGFQSSYSSATGTDNVAVGTYALNANTVSQLTAVGSGALQTNTTGTGNAALGFQALITNTTGGNNTALGYQSLLTNSTGTDNVAVGTYALYANTVSQLTAVGSGALQTNTTGTGNAALGFQALTTNTTGINNTAHGYQALANNTTGFNNTAIGYQSLIANTTGQSNTAVGVDALLNNITGANNTAEGLQALFSNTTGHENTAIGYSALLSNITGYNNTAEGVQALYTNTAGTDNTAVGTDALYANTVSQLTAVGSGALKANTTGTGNAALGFQALTTNTTGANNTAHGYQALASNTTGAANTATGSAALEANTTGAQNIAVGFLALATNTTGGNNTAMGYQSLLTNSTGTDNTAIGYNALKVNTVSQLTAVGSGALQANTTGVSNSAVGYNALSVNSGGSYNTAVGYLSLGFGNTTGQSNTAVGYASLLNLVSGTGNVAIGSYTGQGLTGAESNDIYIGNVGVTSESNAIRIGTVGTQTKAFIAGISGVTSSSGSAVFINSSGQLGTTTSSRKYKDNIEDMNEQSSPILDLRPVSFTYKSDESQTKQFGLIAEEVNDVLPALVLRGVDGQIETVKYHELASLLLNEVIKQHKIIERQQANIEALNEQVARYANIEAILAKFEGLL